MRLPANCSPIQLHAEKKDHDKPRFRTGRFRRNTGQDSCRRPVKIIVAQHGVDQSRTICGGAAREVGETEAPRGSGMTPNNRFEARARFAGTRLTLSVKC